MTGAGVCMGVIRTTVKFVAGAAAAYATVHAYLIWRDMGVGRERCPSPMTRAMEKILRCATIQWCICNMFLLLLLRRFVWDCVGRKRIMKLSVLVDHA